MTSTTTSQSAAANEVSFLELLGGTLRLVYHESFFYRYYLHTLLLFRVFPSRDDRCLDLYGSIFLKTHIKQQAA